MLQSSASYASTSCPGRSKWSRAGARFGKVAGVLAALVLLIGAGEVRAEPLSVFVSLVPQQYFVQRIGGSLVQTVVMVPPGSSPHAYEPKPEQMRALARAAAYFAIGVEFEKALLPKIEALHPGLRIVRTDAGIDKVPMLDRHHHSHEHEPGHGHANGRELDHDHQNGLDNHIWLAPDLVRIQADNILKVLRELEPAHAGAFEANHAAFMDDLDRLDADIKEILNVERDSAFMVFHPAWGYFARQYGLRQIPVEVEGKEPKARDLQRLIDQARAEGIRVVFVSPQFSTRTAETIAQAINGQVVPVNPLAGDWLENMRMVADKFCLAMRQ